MSRSIHPAALVVAGFFLGWAVIFPLPNDLMPAANGSNHTHQGLNR